MDQIIKSLQLLAGVFLVLVMLTNLDSRIPRFPWDVLVDKFGFRLYIPIISSLVITFLLSILLKNFGI